MRCDSTFIGGVLVAITALLLAPARPALAQVPTPRHGLYVSLGLGFGNLEAGNDQGTAINDDFKDGYSGYLAFGGTLANHWRLGVETNGYISESNGTTASLAFFSVSPTYYPSISYNLWFKGYAGYAVLSTSAVGGVNDKEEGFALGAGIGYDFHITKGGLAIIPFANYLAQVSGGSFTALPGETFKASLFQMGVGVGYRH
jgi:hypothetical protein